MTCLLSSQSQGAHVMKNWHPFVSFPLLAIDNSPALRCCIANFSSANISPYIDSVPVPSPYRSSQGTFMKSPPWIMKSRIILCKELPLYPIGFPSTLYSPVQNCLKFSAV
eukprot:TRINITY_DN898_c0_g1_i13.p3 TRINITY_DN898_c0_g1~~TRINITY_DN898_c0_g1_i13.p3  ORF type:complete len:110 (+),score=10.84 TRINITY_DN898_c0_g1_i13:263-592(+)